MKTFRQIITRNYAVGVIFLLGFGISVPEAIAQNYNDGYNNNNQNYNNGQNNNQGYNDQNNNNQGYNDQNNQGYNDQNYNDQGYNNQDYGNNQGYNNNYNNGDNGYGYGDYSEFYNDLAPYGQWLSDPQYGYVWTPYNAGRNFRPYFTNGYWVMTEYGNTWVSNYPWGWATFHYGRWAQSDFYGWVWIPGNTWGPAWVNWRQGGGYYGWAPMGPGISISFSFGSGYDVPNPWWTFIPCGNIYAHDYGRYYAPRQTVNIINNTTIINNTYVDNRSHNTYVTGPRRSEIETTTRIKVPVYQLNNSSARGATQISGNSVSIYKPTINRISSSQQARIAPTQVKALETSAVNNNGGGKAPTRNMTIPSRTNSQISNGAPANTSTRPNASGFQQQNNQKNLPVQQTKANQPAFQQQQQAQQQQRVQQQQLSQQRTQQQQIQQQQKVQQQQAQAQQLQQQRAQQQQAQQQQLEQQRAQQQQAQAQQQRMQQQQLQQQRAQQQQQMQQQRVQQQQMQQQRAQQQQVQQQRVQQQRVQQQPVQQQRAPQPKVEPVQRER